MHIFLLNWRDIKHPRRGGAEVLTHGIFARLVERGHRVTWFASDFPGAARTERLDGIDIVRGGNAVTVRIQAARYYASAPRFDVVVDEINTLPFFSPLYTRVPVVAFICQLAREVWFYEAPPVVAQIGYAIEPFYLRPYRTVPVMTISASSEESLRREMHFRGQMGVLPMAIDQFDIEPPLSLSQRDDVIVSLGRITRSKRLDHTIRALAMLTDPPWDRLRLAIIGGGSEPLQAELTRLAAFLGVGQRIDWMGYLDEASKRMRLRRAKALVMNSAREGWGLAVSEANLLGTPAVAYGILGLRDSVKSGTTGLLTEESPTALAEGLKTLLAEPERYGRFAAAAQTDARMLTWGKSTSFVEAFLTRMSEGR